MNKEELNQEIEKLKASLEAHESQVKDLNHDLKIANQRLADADKHKLPESYFGKIEDAILTAIESFEFDNVDSYNAEFQMDYDNKVELSHVEFDGKDELAEDIQRNIEELFGVADESDDDNESPSE
jgi:uncharacterized protein (DUF342 family)